MWSSLSNMIIRKAMPTVSNVKLSDVHLFSIIPGSIPLVSVRWYLDLLDEFCDCC